MLRWRAMALGSFALIFAFGTMTPSKGRTTKSGECTGADVARVENILACTRIIERRSDTEKKSSAYYWRALGKQHNKNLSGAISDLDDAIYLRHSCQTYYTRGNLYYSQKHYDNAIDDMTHAIAFSRPDTYLLRNIYELRAKACIKLGRLDSAIADYSELINKYPNDTYYYYMRIKMFSMGGDYERAFFELNEISRVTSVRALEVIYQKSSIFLQAKDYSSAISKLNELISEIEASTELMANFDWVDCAGPSPYVAYITRGMANYGQGEYDRAISDFSNAIKPNTIYREPYLYRGAAHYKKGAHSLAVHDLIRALSYLDEDSITSARIWRAISLHQRGEYHKASIEIEALSHFKQYDTLYQSASCSMKF